MEEIAGQMLLPFLIVKFAIARLSRFKRWLAQETHERRSE